MTILNEKRTIFDEIIENQLEFGLFLPFLGAAMIFLTPEIFVHISRTLLHYLLISLNMV